MGNYVKNLSSRGRLEFMFETLILRQKVFSLHTKQKFTVTLSNFTMLHMGHIMNPCQDSFFSELICIFVRIKEHFAYLKFI